MKVGPRVWIVCYDVTDDKRRTSIYKTLRGFGDPIQFSVFRCTMSEVQRAELEGRLTETVDHRTDQVILIPLGPPDAPSAQGIRTIGQPLDKVERTVRIF